MSRDLTQLEVLLVEELLDRKVLKKTDNYRYTVYRNLADSTTINVYAKPRVIPRFIEYGYLDKIFSQKDEFGDDLLNHSLQLGEWLKQMDIANTASTYSVRSQCVNDIIFNHSNGRIGKTNWIRQEGICLGERMILYTRLNGKKTINRIDTIRIFPDRISNFKLLPLISSHSSFGTLSQNATLQLIMSIRQELENAGLNKLAEILETSDNEEINHILLENQMNLINCILSVTTLYDFFEDVIPEEQQEKLIVQGDFWKISRNFGKKTELIEEIKAIRKKDLRNRLKSIILNIIDSNASELIPFRPNTDINAKESNLDKVVDTMREVLFRVEMEGEKSKLGQNHTTVDALKYQTNILANNPYNCDGIISFESLFNLEEIKRFITNPSDIYSLIFSIIGLMDNYQASLKAKSFITSQGSSIVQNCIITHEQASFYLPEKFTTLISILDEMERFSYGTLDARVSNFKAAFLGLFGIESLLLCRIPSFELPKDIKNQLMKEVSLLVNEENLDIAPQKLLQEVESFYRGGLNFTSFNFENLETIAKKRLSFTDTPILKEMLNYIVKTEHVEERVPLPYGIIKDIDDLEDPQEEGPRLSLTNNQ